MATTAAGTVGMLREAHRTAAAQVSRCVVPMAVNDVAGKAVHLYSCLGALLPASVPFCIRQHENCFVSVDCAHVSCSQGNMSTAPFLTMKDLRMDGFLTVSGGKTAGGESAGGQSAGGKTALQAGRTPVGRAAARANKRWEETATELPKVSCYFAKGERLLLPEVSCCCCQSCCFCCQR